MYKQIPFWVVSLTALVFCVLCVVLLWVTTATVPARTSLQMAVASTSLPVKDVSTIDLAIIGQNDLFQAVSTGEHAAQPEATVPQIVVPPMPPPPVPAEPTPLPAYAPSFVEPLAITLKGIMFSSDEWFNRVIIEDNSTKKEGMYKVGDVILDGEIMSILPDRVNIIRVNGQTETIFINEQEAQEYLESTQDTRYEEVIVPTGPDQYRVYTRRLAKKLHSMAQLLQELDMTMAFEHGVAQGLRVGNIPAQGLGAALGLMPQDILYQVDDVRPVTTQQRVALYERIKTLPTGSHVVVKLTRQGQQRELTYTLVHAQAQVPAQQPVPTPPAPVLAHEDMTNTLLAHAQQQQEPMLAKMHDQMKNTMKTYSARAEVAPDER